MTESAYWVRRGIEDKERQTRQTTEAERVRSERYAKAWTAAFERFPELRVGTEANPNNKCHPCPWLVWAILNLTRRDGGDLKRGMVLAERRRLMGRGAQQEERSAA